ncbi:MAG TPA: ERCC4 domain-containing protein [Burkholderiales bacterium]|nr:ERCC4 domain-containing protein [Burkholderiales bacterium]
MNPFVVQIDHRESSGAVAGLLKQSPDFHVTVTHLKLGDYLVDGRFLFERKTLPDLVISIVSGRLFTQALRLVAISLRPAIILEGTVQDLSHCGMSWESIQGALVTVTLFCGIPLLRTRTPAETVSTMRFAAQQGTAFAAASLPRPGYRPRGKRARQLFILQGLPGIGPERARQLLARFGSVEATIRASSEDLQSIRGIGKSRAEKLRWAVEEPPFVYN